MAFSKSFPRNVKGTSYPVWEEVFLTDAEEKQQDQLARQENIKLMEECLDDAKALILRKQLKEFQSNLVDMAIAFFEKRASHTVYWKERKAKEKFDL